MKKYVDKEIFLKSLRRRQKILKYNDKTLSIEAGLNPTAIRDIFKKQKNMPRFDTIAALADALCCTPEQLVYDRGAPDSTALHRKISDRMTLKVIQHALEFRDTDYSNQQILDASIRALKTISSDPDFTSRDIDIVFRSMNLIKKNH
ncbi:MAG: helix-turn-helix transcriptional regulator [Alphaproteobacteria bacterium]|nr:helix-turn-helix transcriptional regulator [Alphaproteobacteria bacterium]